MPSEFSPLRIISHVGSLQSKHKDMPPKGGGDKSSQFWSAIISQKQDTIRWSFNYGGISAASRDEDGYCGIHIAAKNNKVLALCTLSLSLSLSL
jgi:hypothetical protein